MQTILRLVKCSGSVTNNLPDGMNVRGELRIGSSMIVNEDFTNIPKSLRVGGKLDLMHCRNLYSLPSDLLVRGDLYLTGSGLRNPLPVNFKVGGSLHLPGLEEPEDFISKGLKVGESLYLSRCISIIPPKIIIGGDLDITWSSNLQSISKDIVINGNIIAGLGTSYNNGKSGGLLSGILPYRLQNKILWEDN